MRYSETISVRALNTHSNSQFAIVCNSAALHLENIVIQNSVI